MVRVALLVALALSSAARAQEAVPPAVLEWVRANAVVLEGSSPDLEDGDLDALAPVLGDAKVVGIGEGTHGTKEFFEFRDRVVRWLARRGELDAVLWETGFDRSLEREAALNDPAVALEDVGLLGGVWGTDENEALLAFLRGHNAGAARPVRFVGVDAFDFPRAVVSALEAAGGDAATAAGVLEDAFGQDPRSVCPDPEPCYTALFGRTLDQLRRLAAAAEWMADALEDDDWRGAASARVVAHRVRHLLQFALLSPADRRSDRTLLDLDAQYGDAFGRAQSAVRRSAAVLEAALEDEDPAYWGAVSSVVRAVPDGLEVYRDSLGPAGRYAWDEAARGLRARVGTGRYRAPGLGAAADTLVAFVDLLHESLRTPPSHMDFDNEREVAIGAVLATVARALVENGRAVLGAHNGHVGYNPSETLARTSSGAFARDALGDDYLAVGTFFGAGRFQAYDVRANAEGWDGPAWRAFEVGPPPAGSFEAALWAAGPDAFALDLRTLPDSGPVAEWFRAARPARNIGNSYDPDRPGDFSEAAVVADGFDVVVFFRTTDRAVPTAAERARGGYDLE